MRYIKIDGVECVPAVISTSWTVLDMKVPISNTDYIAV